MDSMDDLDNLMDNFDLHSFWDRKKLFKILGAYLLVQVVAGVFVIRAVLDASEAGAAPKGMDLNFPDNPRVVR